MVAYGYLALPGTPELREVARDGKSGQGRATSMGSTDGTGPRIRNATHTVEYAYEVDGTEYKGSTTMNVDEFRAYNVGRPIVVHYLPRDPSISGYHVDFMNEVSTQPSIWAWILVGLGGAGLVGSLAFGRRDASSPDA